MELEERVERLEGDIKLLKNEVREVLMNIREQLIENHMAQNDRSSRNGGKANGEGIENVQYQAAEEAPVDLDAVTAVGEWMTGKVKKYGTARMKEILELYQVTGRISNGTKETLVRLINLDEYHEGSGLSSGDSASLLRELDEILVRVREGKKKENHG